MTYPPEGPNSGSPGYGAGGYGSHGPSYGATPQGPSTQGPSPQGQSSQGPTSQGPSQQTPGQQSYSQPGQYSPSPASNMSPASKTPLPLPRILTLVVAALGGIGFLVGLAGQYSAFDVSSNFFQFGNGDPTSIALLLASGLVAAVGLLPKQSSTIGIAAALAVSGWLTLVFQSFNIDSGGGMGSSIGLGTGAIIVLVLGFFQSLAAIAALLFGADVLKVPAPKDVSYGQQNQFQGYSPTPGYRQPGQQPPNYGYGQPQQSYGGPVQGGYVPPTYPGQPAPNQPARGQNPSGSLGYPVDPQQHGASGPTGSADQSSPYSQYQYGQPPVGSAGSGAPQHAVSPETQAVPTDQQSGGPSTPTESGSTGGPSYSEPTQAFGTTPANDDEK
ncbi:hypothetical protein BJD99_11680 [Rhodococcus sp. 1163]|nr:hypothetical protein BJD99_11680 [Rhodococcus sp. 1163]